MGVVAVSMAIISNPPLKMGQYSRKGWAIVNIANQEQVCQSLSPPVVMTVPYSATKKIPHAQD